MTERLSTGLDQLDNDLQGGIPHGSIIVIMGDKKTGVEQLADYIQLNALNDGGSGIFMALEKAPSKFKENANYYGWEYGEFERSKNLMFVDGYSWQTGEPETDHYLTGLTDLNQISMKFIRAIHDLKSDPDVSIVNSASALLEYMNAPSAKKLIKVLGAKSAKNQGVLLVALHKSLHDKQERAEIKDAADGVIRLETKDNQPYLGIERMTKTDHAKNWRKFMISSENGLWLI